MKKHPNCFDCNTAPVLLHIEVPEKGLMYAGACPSCKFLNAPSHTKDGAKSIWYRTNCIGQSEHNMKLRRERQNLIRNNPFEGEVIDSPPMTPTSK